jgi:hypothetical protein
MSALVRTSGDGIMNLESALAEIVLGFWGALSVCVLFKLVVVLVMR